MSVALTVCSLRKQPFLLAPRRWGCFHEEQRLRLSDRNSILMTQINVYIINPVVMGFQTQVCSILRFSWSILVKSCVHLLTSSSKTQMLLLENNILHKYWLFCCRFIAFTLILTFVVFCLLSVIRKQWLRQRNYSVVQSALMTGFWTDFTSSVWNFCGWVVDVPPRETSTSGEEWGETAVFAALAVWRDFKTPLPSTMTDGRLISLVILHKHKQVDIDGIITEFPRLKGRRLFRPLLVAPLMTSLFYSFFFSWTM